MATTRKPQEKYGVVSATTIKGESVINREDEKLGKIDELMIDANTGHLAYAVLAFSGSHYAVPWSAFEFANTEQKLILDVDKEKLKAAPGFDKNEPWPDFADRAWGGEVHKYFGSRPYWGN
jgi:sporulation protein YlmC with PRC-barrel domain